MRPLLRIATVFIAAAMAAIDTASARRDSLPGQKSVFRYEYPAYLAFRGEMNRLTRTDSRAWVESVDSAAGFMKKFISEELELDPQMAVRANTYAAEHSEKLALLHLNGEARRIWGHPEVLERYFPGHWVYQPGAVVAEKLSAEDTEVRVGDTADCDMFFNDYCSNESFVIRNNIFRYSRRYGMLIQATHGRIENNEFTGLSSSGIVLQNSASWPEGFVPYSVLVSGNLISGCGFDDTYLREGLSPIAIRTMTYLETTSAGYVPPVWKGVRNIEVSSNTVRTESASGIAVWDADEITFRDNRIECTGEPSIRTERCTNVVME